MIDRQDGSKIKGKGARQYADQKGKYMPLL